MVLKLGEGGRGAGGGGGGGRTSLKRCESSSILAWESEVGGRRRAHRSPADGVLDLDDDDDDSRSGSDDWGART